MENLQQIFLDSNSNFINQGLDKFLFAAVILILSYIALTILRKFISRRVEKRIIKSENRYDDLILETVNSILSWPIALVISFNIAVSTLFLPDIFEKGLTLLNLSVLFLYGAFLINKIIDFGGKRFVEMHLSQLGDQEEIESDDDKQNTAIIRFITNVAKGLVWIVAILLLLQNLGYNVSALIAGLGIGGLAIAFALQNVIEDGFSAISIYFNKPFKIGDTIKFKGELATTKSVGLTNSRFKTSKGDELVIPNRVITGTELHNFGEMLNRRVTNTLGVTYDTNRETLVKIPEILESITNEFKEVEFVRARFFEFGDYSLKFTHTYLILDSSFDEYMRLRHEINMRISEEFENNLINFAYPTQTINVKNS